MKNKMVLTGFCVFWAVTAMTGSSVQARGTGEQKYLSNMFIQNTNEDTGYMTALNAYDENGEKMFWGNLVYEYPDGLFRMYLNQNNMQNEYLYVYGRNCEKSIYDGKKLLRKEMYAFTFDYVNSSVGRTNEVDYVYEEDDSVRYGDNETSWLDENLNVVRTERTDKDGNQYVIKESAYDEYGNLTEDITYDIMDGSFLSGERYEFDENGAPKKLVLFDENKNPVEELEIQSIAKADLKADEYTGWWASYEDSEDGEYLQFIGLSANGFCCFGSMYQDMPVEILDVGWYRIENGNLIFGTEFMKNGKPDESKTVTMEPVDDFITKGMLQKMNW